MSDKTVHDGCAYKRKDFLDGLSSDFAERRKRPDEWQEELEERRIWDATLSDHQDDQ